MKKYEREKRGKNRNEADICDESLKETAGRKKVTGRKKIVGASGLHRRRKYRYR